MSSAFGLRPHNIKKGAFLLFIMQPKKEFLKRIKLLCPDYKLIKPRKIIRVNTLKISIEKLKKIIREKNWKFSQPLFSHPEIIELKDVKQLGNTEEFKRGYFYIQDLASIMPVLALSPKPREIILDLCASPGSKTTYLADLMKNSGTIIANEKIPIRLRILAINLQKSGVSNTIITRESGEVLCKKLRHAGFSFDKILIDAPCSGEGTFCSDPESILRWNIKTISKYASLQKRLLESALQVLKPKGTLIYSTCTHSPEENELVLQHLIDKFNIKIKPFKLPLKTRPGITNWKGKKLDSQIKHTHRIYPQDNNTHGFFIARLRR